MQTFHGLDLELAIVAANREKGIDCYPGNALATKTLQRFVNDNVIFFGTRFPKTVMATAYSVSMKSTLAMTISLACSWES